MPWVDSSSTSRTAAQLEASILAAAVSGGARLQSVAYAASITPNFTTATDLVVGTLTGNLTINAPLNPAAGHMTFYLTQDATGGRAVTWNSVFILAGQPDTTPGVTTAVEFGWNGTKWVQVGVYSTPAVGGDTTPPTAPGNLTAVPADSLVDLSWLASTDNIAVVGYRVYRNGVLVGSPAAVPAPTFQDTLLANGTTYTYTVKAIDAAGNLSAASTAVPATPLGGVTQLWAWDAINAPLHPDADRKGSRFAEYALIASEVPNMTLKQYGVALAYAQVSDPTAIVTRTSQGGTINVRLPRGSQPAGGTDKHLTIFDETAGTEIDLYAAQLGTRTDLAQAFPRAVISVDSTVNYRTSGYLSIPGVTGLVQYTGTKSTATKTGTTTSGSAIVTGLSGSDATTMLFVGQRVTGTGVPANSTIASIQSDTQVTLSANATASGSPVLTFLPVFTGCTGGTGTAADNAIVSEVTAGGVYDGLIDNCTAGVSFPLGAVNEGTSGWGGNAANTPSARGLITPEDVTQYKLDGTVPAKTLQFSNQWIGPGVAGVLPALHNADTGYALANGAIVTPGAGGPSTIAVDGGYNGSGVAAFGFGSVPNATTLDGYFYVEHATTKQLDPTYGIVGFTGKSVVTGAGNLTGCTGGTGTIPDNSRLIPCFSDGVPTQIREGEWLRLDPAVDVDALGLTDWEAMVAKIMQRHGMICRDNGGATSIYAEDTINRGGMALWNAAEAAFGVNDNSEVFSAGFLAAMVDNLQLLAPPPMS